MRVGIIGGGAAGLTTAWLLDDSHAVTLFEKQNRLGGHADTVLVDRDGEQIPIDAGFEFFSDHMFPTFRHLLQSLDVTLRQYAATATFYRTDNRHTVMLPPFRNGRILWSMLKPRPMFIMLQFQHVLNSATRLMQMRDTSVTLEQFLDHLAVHPSFKNNFLYPFLLAGWCVEPEEFKQFAAYDALRYTFMHRTAGWRAAALTEVIGGTQAYVNALTRTLTRTTIKLSSNIIRLTRDRNAFIVHDANGTGYEFDHLVIATNASEACELLAHLEDTEHARELLGQMEYFKTTIAVHGDRRLMPASEKHWSVVNTRWDGKYSQNTVWKGWKSRKPIFKSWVTYEARMPEPLYATATYYHPKVNANYFQAQQSLATRLGKDGLWLAGMYMHDVDCHESAVMSAVRVVQRLDPQSPRLSLLLAQATPE